MRSTRQITVVGCHAEGEIGYVTVGGVLPPPVAPEINGRAYLTGAMTYWLDPDDSFPDSHLVARRLGRFDPKRQE